jgi:hypothetical protein
LLFSCAIKADVFGVGSEFFWSSKGAIGICIWRTFMLEKWGVDRGMIRKKTLLHYAPHVTVESTTSKAQFLQN